MKNPVFEVITLAIDGHHLLRITDEAGERLLEPYLIFESKEGDMLLHSWQRSGNYRSTPPPRFCNLHVEDIAAAELLEERFMQPHPGYNPKGSQFHRVLYAVDRGPVAGRAAPSRSARLRSTRRSPPSSRARRTRRK